MAEFIAKFVKCPFYLDKQNDTNRIKCEGVCNNTSTHLVFRGDKRWYMKDFCCKNYEACRVFRMLEAKYDE